jgi:hypothetical protein
MRVVGSLRARKVLGDIDVCRRRVTLITHLQSLQVYASVKLVSLVLKAGLRRSWYRELQWTYTTDIDISKSVCKCDWGKICQMLRLQSQRSPLM